MLWEAAAPPSFTADRQSGQVLHFSTEISAQSPVSPRDTRPRKMRKPPGTDPQATLPGPTAGPGAQRPWAGVPVGQLRVLAVRGARVRGPAAGGEADTAPRTAAGDGCHGEKSASFAMGGQNRGRGRHGQGRLRPRASAGRRAGPTEKMGARTRVEVGLRQLWRPPCRQFQRWRHLCVSSNFLDASLLAVPYSKI